MRTEVGWRGTQRYAVYITNWILYNYLMIKLGAAESVTSILILRDGKAARTPRSSKPRLCEMPSVSPYYDQYNRTIRYTVITNCTILPRYWYFNLSSLSLKNVWKINSKFLREMKFSTAIESNSDSFFFLVARRIFPRLKFTNRVLISIRWNCARFFLEF